MRVLAVGVLGLNLPILPVDDDLPQGLGLGQVLGALDGNSGLAKLDAALRFVLNAYAEANNGKQPSAKEIEQIRQGIQIKHADLDRFGGLSKPTEAA